MEARSQALLILSFIAWFRGIGSRRGGRAAAIAGAERRSNGFGWWCWGRGDTEEEFEFCAASWSYVMGGRLCGPRQWRNGFGFPLRGDGDGRKLRGYVGWLLPCGPLVSRLDELCVAYFGKEKTILDRVKTYPMLPTYPHPPRLRVKSHHPLSDQAPLWCWCPWCVSLSAVMCW
jgi:hypothetical protein